MVTFTAYTNNGFWSGMTNMIRKNSWKMFSYLWGFMIQCLCVSELSQLFPDRNLQRCQQVVQSLLCLIHLIPGSLPQWCLTVCPPDTQHVQCQAGHPLVCCPPAAQQDLCLLPTGCPPPLQHAQPLQLQWRVRPRCQSSPEAGEWRHCFRHCTTRDHQVASSENLLREVKIR